MYSKKQRIAAMIGVILLLALIVATILAAAFDQSGNLFKALLFASIALPILLWIYIWMIGRLTGRHTIADFRAGKDDPKENIPADDDQGDAQSVTISKNPFLDRSDK